LGGFPTHPGAVSARWLTQRLRETGQLGDGAVSSGRSDYIGTGQVGDTVRLRLTYCGPEKGPDTLAANFSAADRTSRGTAAMMGLYAKEVNFYGHAAPPSTPEAPHPLCRDERGRRRTDAPVRRSRPARA